ncbi:MAG: undecaprenyldiphospho-muramoylpentapeptide beta-N-acetylglucosaminyltransferase [Spirochaetaceae bacterium]|jgi:UDP-N-acetylglucosamine--N-acetylmuramyl-(pentapeptide) pyrophosphoryl-undecaprenol N-acetylglucosamine transferase|nr:undecaprenyldiphospho-muramoylpentapeptide beta-N-acetylglucosaminyltransferase [Spirochaetaceae bacterium]
MGEVMTIAFCGGGTGGHIYPGLAIIGALREIEGGGDIRVFWIGSKRGMDSSIIAAAGIPFYGIHSGKLRRYISFSNILDIFNIIAGFIESLCILKKEKPDMLFSKGGFVSVPPALAAYFLRIPFWTHESDYSMGLANKINARFASKIWLSYEDTSRSLPARLRTKIIAVGNPVRKKFYNADAAKGKSFLGVSETENILLVLGGSQGAREINNIVSECQDELTKYFTVVHQTGIQPAQVPACVDSEKTGGAKNGKYITFAYINDEMPDVLAAAALVAGRSGAGTVWECAACGKPMILIPLAGSGTRGDQVENARFFAAKGAALCLIHPPANEFVQAVKNLAASAERLQDMAAASKSAGASPAADYIAQEIVKFLT